ncbi:MAG: DUF2164 domain-containing protein [Campylobacterota bacterium]|nr:DUF2164 domain-containing protein [Campylobacterota bacterium]
MTNLQFTSHEKEILVHKIQNYFENELSEEIGQFDAEFLLDFFSKEIGGYHYNRGLQDARTLIEENTQNLSQTFYEMEEATEFVKS